MVDQHTAFISYRRKHFDRARLVRDGLHARHVDAYLDVDEMHAGLFNTQLLNEIAQRGFFILVLAPGSLDDCWREGDWLWREIEYAHRASRTFVPVKSVDFDDEELRRLTPEVAEKIRYSQAVRLDADLFDARMDGLASLITKSPPPPPASTLGPPVARPQRPPRRRWPVALGMGAAAAIVIVLAALVFNTWPFEDETDASTTDVPTSDTNASGDSDTLPSNGMLSAGDDPLASNGGLHELRMTSAGQLMATTEGQEWWSEPALSDAVPGSFAFMGDDGNLVIYGGMGPDGPQDATWNSGTSGNDGARLVISDEGGLGYVVLVTLDGDQIRRYRDEPDGGGGDTEPEQSTAPSSSTSVDTTTPTTVVPVTVPSVVGLDADVAKSRLEAEPNRYDVFIAAESSSEVADGLAIRTQPPAGATLAPGSRISLFISSGS